MRQVVSYMRVSTAQQGKSGLGIEAQRAALARFVEAEGCEVIGEYVEVETGQGAETQRAGADAFTANVLPVARQIRDRGASTPRAIAEALNARGIRTARGGAWHDSTVRNLLARA